MGKPFAIRVGAATALVLLLTGCAAPTPEPEVVTSAETCDQVGDVFTIIFNAYISFDQGRSIQQEMDGALRLAARVLDRVPAEPGTDLAEAVDALKLAAPAAGVGAMNEPVDIESAEWRNAHEQVSIACDSADTPIGISGWTGG